MNWLTTSLLAFAAAVVGWLATDFVASPVRRFFNLRIEIIRRMTQFANVRARWKELRDDPNRLEDLGLSEKDQQDSLVCPIPLTDTGETEPFRRKTSGMRYVSLRGDRVGLQQPPRETKGSVGCSQSLLVLSGWS